MPCIFSCAVSTIFIIGMIYFYNVTEKSNIVRHYKSTLTHDLQKRYDKIIKERMKISYQGYILGFIFSLGIIYYNLNFKSEKVKNTTLVCIVVATTFVTNYFYYILHPKSDWMLYHLKNKEEVSSWLHMYRVMQHNYHMGLTLGIIGAGVLAFAFRC